MHSYTVLVLGAEQPSWITEIVFQLGFAPLVRNTIAGALKAIRSERILAVLLDSASVQADPVEFVLNVRDFDRETPVVIIAGSESSERNPLVIQRLPRTHLVAGVREAGEVAARLAEILAPSAADG